MKKGMVISLKAGERIFINGAVIRVDRRMTLELLNDVSFLLESHVMQAESATTPLRQLYFIAQTMLMDPANAEATCDVFRNTHGPLMAAFANEQILDGLSSAADFIGAGRIFDALKILRGLYHVEEEILASNKKPFDGSMIEERSHKTRDQRQVSSPASRNGGRLGFG